MKNRGLNLVTVFTFLTVVCGIATQALADRSTSANSKPAPQASPSATPTFNSQDFNQFRDNSMLKNLGNGVSRLGGGSDGGASAHTFDQMQLVYLLEAWNGDSRQARLKPDLIHFIEKSIQARVQQNGNDKDAGYVLSLNPGVLALRNEINNATYQIVQSGCVNSSCDGPLANRNQSTITFYVDRIAAHHPGLDIEGSLKILGKIALTQHLQAFSGVSSRTQSQFLAFFDQYASTTESDRFFYSANVNTDASIPLTSLAEKERGISLLIGYSDPDGACNFGGDELSGMLDGANPNSGVNGATVLTRFEEVRVLGNQVPGTDVLMSQSIATQAIYPAMSEKCFPRKWGCILGKHFCVGDSGNMLNTIEGGKTQKIPAHIVAVWPYQDRVIVQADSTAGMKSFDLYLLNARSFETLSDEN